MEDFARLEKRESSSDTPAVTSDRKTNNLLKMKRAYAQRNNMKTKDDFEFHPVNSPINVSNESNGIFYGDVITHQQLPL